jgi:Fibronectin type III domain
MRQAGRGLVVGAVLAWLGSSPLWAQTYPTADGQTDTYTLINGVLAPGANATETPDCSHPAFGPHITQAADTELGKAAFIFHIHVTPDNDRCVAFDRQRNEIKTYGPSPDYLKGFFGDTVTYRWRFRLDAGFQPSPNFTHVHQIKAGDGTNADAPIFTLTPRSGSPDKLELIHVDSAGVTTKVQIVDLAGFKGQWVEAYEKVTYTDPGAYSIEIRRLSDGALLLSYANAAIETWRTGGTTFVRPKWGIYRSLNSSSYLRDEQVRFDRFCLAKGTDDCPASPGPTPSPTPIPAPPAAPTGLTATPGGKKKIDLGWTASTGAASYNVKRATTAGGPYSLIASGVTGTTYTSSGLRSGTSYCYVVSALNSSGESGNSNEACATAP